MIPDRIRHLAARTQPWVAEASCILARITLGQAFLLTGLGKLRHLEATTSFFQSLGLPAPGVHAVVIGGIECAGGAALLLGLGVRPVAGLLLATMAGAILTAHRGDLASAIALAPEAGLTDLTPWMFALVLLPLLAHGGGRFALDRLICRRGCPAA